MEQSTIEGREPEISDAAAERASDFDLGGRSLEVLFTDIFPEVLVFLIEKINSFAGDSVVSTPIIFDTYSSTVKEYAEGLEGR